MTYIAPTEPLRPVKIDVRTVDNVSGRNRAVRSAGKAKTILLNWLPLFSTVLLLASWSGAFVGVRIALEGYSPSEVAFLRYLIASLIFVVYAVITKMPRPLRRDLPGIAGLGLLGFAAYALLLNFGEQTVSSGVSSLIITAEGAMIALLARIFLKEKLSLLGWGGVALCMIGSMVLSLGSDSSLHITAGVLLLLGAMLVTSLYTIGLRVYADRYNGIHLTAWMMWASVPLLFIAAPGAIGTIAAAPIQSTLAIVFLAIFPSVIGYTLWTLLITRISIARAGSITTLIPIGALILGWLLLQELPSSVALTGGAVILCGVLLVNRAEA